MILKTFELLIRLAIFVVNRIKMGKPVFLIGYMGSGKSTAGKKLARTLGYFFTDLDEEIEKMTGKPIHRIFSEDGEDAFRQLEHSILVSLAARKNMVIATGGGAPCFFDNMELMKQSGVTVYLKMKPESLAKRLANAKIKRPLLAGVSIDELPAYIKNHLDKREPFYASSHISQKGESLDSDELLKHVRDYL